MSTAVSSLDVAAYVLSKMGEMTTIKLQKLVYYCQAWHLVWDEEPLFDDAIQAWANGPVIPKLYDTHRGKFKISEVADGDTAALTKAQKASIDAVLKFYGSKSSQWLVELTHQEDPWISARRGLAPGAKSRKVISQSSMAEYYSSL